MMMKRIRKSLKNSLKKNLRRRSKKKKVRWKKVTLLKMRMKKKK
jgi:hypothetical protein